jgi:hypothetical protein
LRRRTGPTPVPRNQAIESSTGRTTFGVEPNPPSAPTGTWTCRWDPTRASRLRRRWTSCGQSSRAHTRPRFLCLSVHSARASGPPIAVHGRRPRRRRDRGAPKPGRSIAITPYSAARACITGRYRMWIRPGGSPPGGETRTTPARPQLGCRHRRQSQSNGAITRCRR